MQVSQTRSVINSSIAKILNVFHRSPLTNITYNNAVSEIRVIAEDETGKNELEPTNTQASLGSRLYKALSCNVQEDDELFSVKPLTTDINTYNITAAIKLFSESIETYGYTVVFQELVTHMTFINDVEVMNQAISNYESIFYKVRYIGPYENTESFNTIMKLALFEYIVTYCDILDNWNVLASIHYVIYDCVYAIRNSATFDEFHDEFCKRHKAGIQIMDQAENSSFRTDLCEADLNDSDNDGSCVSTPEEYEELITSKNIHWDNYLSAKREFIALYTNKRLNNSQI